jgi:CheY-like chemotaxis protein
MKTRRAMIVDDSPAFRTVLASILQINRWEIIEAIDGLDALEKLEEHSPDVLIVDHRMPRLNGAQLYERLRTEGREIPFVLVSAAQDVHEIAERAGIEHVLQKPFDLPEIEQMLLRATSAGPGPEGENS